ncbi:proteoglycan 4-like [Macrosteles quadrilineatus]|uniref:proteoglycan 4-like n=1 Tax=Macrosteles quadrilineatus TaxID=74068 RepID=UPI0023E1A56A|nr:proteoglycan 4-like [Macrosteles quadrilineatus]
MSRQRIMIPEAFKVLPPLSPELPAPPRAPPPHRVAPPVARREKTAFVILNDEAPPHGRSRDNSPNGRVSPFRGRGFREETSRHASREPSPSPDRARRIPPRARSRSTSRLPVATPRTINGSSTPTSPPGVSGIPKPISRRNSLSPNRATQVLNQVNRNKSIKLPSQGKPVIIKPVSQSPRHSVKTGVSPKRVGPSEISKSLVNGTKPPIPKIQGTQNQKNGEKENDKRGNLTSPYRKRPQPSKPEAVKSPSRIPRTRSVSRGREDNVRASSPVRAVVRASRKLPQGSTKPANGDKKGVSNIERRNNAKKTGPIADKKNATPKTSVPTTPATLVEEKPKLNLDLDNKVPTPIEAVVSTLPGTDDKTPELEKKEIQEAPIEVQPQAQVQSPPPAKTAEVEKENKTEETQKPQEAPTAAKDTKEEVPEATVTLVRTTTAPALELAQPDVIPTILSKGEQEISKSISEGPSEEDQDENPGGPKGETLASVESVRSNSSVETVRAATKGQGRENEVEVLSANNLMKSDGHTRNVAWDK